MIPTREIRWGYEYEGVQMCHYEIKKRNQDKINTLFRDAKIPDRYQECGWEDYHITKDNQAAIDAAYDLIEGRSSGVIFHGKRGTGKTMLASIIANELAKRGQPVLFTSMPELFDSIRARFSTGNAKDVVDGVKEAPFLILDDMGTEKMTDWVSEQLFIVINHRYNKQLPLIITTNYDPQTFARTLCIMRKDGLDKVPSERIISRLRQMCKFVHLGGGDWRR